MILVDVFVPSVDKTYDFSLNDNVAVSVIIEEIAEMVSQKEKSELAGDVAKLELCDAKRKLILNKEETLFSSDIKTGDSLILV